MAPATAGRAGAPWRSPTSAAVSNSTPADAAAAALQAACAAGQRRHHTPVQVRRNLRQAEREQRHHLQTLVNLDRDLAAGGWVSEGVRAVALAE